MRVYAPHSPRGVTPVTVSGMVRGMTVFDGDDPACPDPEPLGTLVMSVRLTVDENIVLIIRGHCEIHISPESALELATQLIEVAKESKRFPGVQ